MGIGTEGQGKGGEREAGGGLPAGAGTAMDLSGRLFAAASHDLRQPLAALSLLVGALDGRVSDPASRDLLQAMGNAIQSMKRMMEGHFDLVRLEAGLCEPDVGSHAVNGILTRLALEVAPRFDGGSLRFSVMPCSAQVRTDPLMMERLLEGLVTNALRHTARGRVVVGCRRSGGHLRIEVWDNGRGLSADELAALHRVLDGAEGGVEVQGVLGLGLTLARGIARRLGLRLAVRSAAGRGTVFSVLVPRAPETEEEPEPASGDPGETLAPDISRARVLVIEDDDMVLAALQALLEQWGCAVTGADSFDAAVERLGPSPQPPDLVISDLRLKGAANGIVAIRQLAKVLDTELPGLILTGDTDPRRLREARLSGYPLLHKPVAPLALRAALARLLGRGKLIAGGMP
ncbi:ATP-binding response regulator [Azospirillum thermophilum]|uniref:histidine kinase n=1 Tax=Azospirillum thermophilum TaxID=2202148 RepID=A0A2S2CPL5_9PROT|nr:hybrid sensor histidine kinase/response regulator [Azospirillum thermophilum]AWK86464.1 hybrid sensor histidine kinase/response regulator [Azospirillum thermophilum]